MSQSRKHSALEVVASTAFGYVIAVIAQAVIFPLYGVHISLAEDATMALFFTIVSVIRAYVFRRIFNRITEKQNGERRD